MHRHVLGSADLTLLLDPDVSAGDEGTHRRCCSMHSGQRTHVCEGRSDIAELAGHGAVQDPADRVQVVPAQALICSKEAVAHVTQLDATQRLELEEHLRTGCKSCAS